MDGKTTSATTDQYRPSRFGIFMRYTSLCYWSVLTFGLLASNPLGSLRGRTSILHAYAALEPAVHFLSFALLTLLVMCGCWSISRRTMLGVLAAYAAATEILQSMVPGRTPDWADLLQNIAGMGVGLAIWWAAVRIVGLWITSRQTPSSLA